VERWERLGEILVEKGILTAKTVERTLAVSKRHKKRFDVALEDMELVIDNEIAEAFAHQFNLKLASNFSRLAYPQELLRLITPETAMQNLIFPLKLDKDRLLLAMADPTDMTVVNNIGANTGLKIFPCVATRKEIHSAVCKHYFGKTIDGSATPTVLIVEDEAFTQSMIYELLANQGYRLITAKDGMEGFKEVIACKPHVIITDMVMPKMDGYALLEALKVIPETRFIPVILLSGSISDKEEAKVFERGFFDYIPKPISEATLVWRVKRALRFYEHRFCLY
jgi:CheY-like chemotaxis protein